MSFLSFFLFHAVYSTLIAYLLSFAFGALTFGLSVVALFTGSMMALWHGRAFSKLPSIPNGAIELSLSVLVIYAGVRHFLWLMYPADHGIWTLAANNYGDLPLHINYIRAFANGVEFPPLNPSFASEVLRYPFGTDLYNALWESLGVQTQAHLFVVGAVATVLSLAFLFPFGGWWAVGGFFFNGGWLGIVMIINGVPQDRQDGIDWKNLFLSGFITQRGLLFALPIGLFLLLTAHRHFSSQKPMSLTQQIAFGLMWGFLPLFHLHSFVAVSLLLALVAFRYQNFRGIYNLLSSKMATIAYLPAFLFLMHSTDWLKKSAIAHWSWGWMAGEKFLPLYLWENFGFWLLIPLATAGALFFSKDRFTASERKGLWIELIGALLLFTFFFNFMLAPWAWDNIKVLIWPYLAMMRVAYLVLEEPLEKVLDGALKPLFVGVLLLPGLMSVYSSMRGPTQTGVKVYSQEELAYTQGAIDNIPAGAVFAAAPTHHHTLTFFGKLRAVGYEGHLWSHGIQYTDNLVLLKTILLGEEGWMSAVKKLGVTHIFWGPDERSLYGDQEKPWMLKLENISRVPEYKVYEIKAESAQ